MGNSLFDLSAPKLICSYLYLGEVFEVEEWKYYILR